MKPLAITLGDPAGIGSEVVFKAIAQLEASIPLRIFGDWKRAAAAPGSEVLRSLERRRPDEPASGTGRVFVDLGIRSNQPAPRFGVVAAENGRIALESINTAVAEIEAGRCSALVTAPIHKQAIAEAGSRFPGHTELLAARSGLKRYGWDYAMYFDSPALRTVLLSVHVALADAIRTINSETIAALCRLTAREYARLYGTAPRIAVAGVNPHAGEGGMFGGEEAIIRRGVEEARSFGIEVTGPHAPDTVFRSALEGACDVVMAMYHDQGLIPVKTIAFDRSVNVTLGLPYLRCSVDHGTAFDIAGKGLADASPMVYAIRWAAERAERMQSS